jgi:hypothetical protein
MPLHQPEVIDVNIEPFITESHLKFALEIIYKVLEQENAPSPAHTIFIACLLGSVTQATSTAIDSILLLDVYDCFIAFPNLLRYSSSSG